MENTVKKTFIASELCQLIRSFEAATVHSGNENSFLMMQVSPKDIKHTHTISYHCIEFERFNEAHPTFHMYDKYYAAEHMTFAISGNSFFCTIKQDNDGNGLDLDITSDMSDKPIHMRLFHRRPRKKAVVMRLTGLTCEPVKRN